MEELHGRISKRTAGSHGIWFENGFEIMKTYIEINKANLLHNLEEFRKLTNTKIMFVVKANAYGHGLKEVIEITHTLPYIDHYAVDSIEEALLVREIDKSSRKILIIGWMDTDQLKVAIANGFEMVAPSLDYIKLAGSIAKELKTKAQVHVKVETGTARMGMAPSDVVDIMNRRDSLKSVEITGMYSHFANIEDTTDHSYAEHQLSVFNDMLGKFDHGNVLKHFSCSASTLLFPKTYFDIVRLGISAYGFWPSKPTQVSFMEQEKMSISLKPVMSWFAKIAQVKTIAKGEPVGYGLTYKTFEKTKIIIIPVGYYDGYDRKFSNSATVIVNGAKAPVRGRICMNMFMVDVTHLKGFSIKAGDRVVLLGEENGERITADGLAELAGTINYEIVSRINPLIPRIIV